MSGPVRLTGHVLQGEGAAYIKERYDRQPRRVHNYGSGGTGFGLCSCGARSAVMKAGTKRKAWHRAHKDQIRAEATK